MRDKGLLHAQKMGWLYEKSRDYSELKAISYVRPYATGQRAASVDWHDSCSSDALWAEKAVQLFSTASQESKDADIKAFATKILPTLQEHLHMARQLAQQQEMSQGR